MSPAIFNSTPHALAALLHHRWTLPILAEVADKGGCKFITLNKRLGVAPQSLKRSLARLAELDLVVRNAGYGHPLRPEYVLGDTGREVAAPAAALWRSIRDSDLAQPMLKKWSLPTLAAVGLGAQRFNEIRALLADATPRATALALKDLVAGALTTRRINEAYPPTPFYTPAPQSEPMLRHIYALAEPLARNSVTVCS